MTAVLRVAALPAGPGDALVVEWGEGRRRWRMLVDAGPGASWDAVGARLRARPRESYELFVVTHVDEDHIGGALRLLHDADLAPRVQAVLFNGYVHCQRGGNVLGPVHGEQLTQRIVDAALPWNPGRPQPIAPGVGGPVVVASAGELPALDLPGGARAVLLSPSGPKLRKMAGVWEDAVVAAGLVPGRGAGGEGAAVRQRPRVFPPLPAGLDRAALPALAAGRERDSSAANGSSIAFVLEYAGRRLLLTGDAHPDLLAANLARYAARVGEDRARLDLVKLPHHGSRSNVTAELAASWSASRFLISTDGSGYAHPDDSALARLMLAADAPAEFFVNHPGGGPARWVPHADALGVRFHLPDDPAAGIVVDV